MNKAQAFEDEDEVVDEVVLRLLQFEISWPLRKHILELGLTVTFLDYQGDTHIGAGIDQERFKV